MDNIVILTSVLIAKLSILMELVKIVIRGHYLIRRKGFVLEVGLFQSCLP